MPNQTQDANQNAVEPRQPSPSRMRLLRCAAWQARHCGQKSVSGCVPHRLTCALCTVHTGYFDWKVAGAPCSRFCKSLGSRCSRLPDSETSRLRWVWSICLVSMPQIPWLRECQAGCRATVFMVLQIFDCPTLQTARSRRTSMIKSMLYLRWFTLSFVGMFAEENDKVYIVLSKFLIKQQTPVLHFWTMHRISWTNVVRNFCQKIKISFLKNWSTFMSKLATGIFGNVIGTLLNFKRPNCSETRVHEFA